MGYHDKTFNPKRLNDTVKAVAKVIRHDYSKGRFETIAFRGISGSSIAFPLSVMHGIPIAAVRRPSENSHGSPVQGDCEDAKTYAIIDDFICSGETMNAIYKAIKEHYRVNLVKRENTDSKPRWIAPECTAIYLYNTEALSMSGRDSFTFTDGPTVPVIRIVN